jgi:hypothetical protein
MDHDRLFKLLLITFFFEIIELLLPQVAQYLSRDRVEFLDKEIFTDLTSGQRNEVDVLAKVKFRDKDAFFLMLVEPMSATPGRLFADDVPLRRPA